MKDNYVAMLLEDMNGKFDFILENIVPDVQTLKQDVRQLKTDMRAVKADIHVLKALYNDHQKRLGVLEAR